MRLLRQRHDLTPIIYIKATTIQSTIPCQGVAAVILAAGKGTRMQSPLAKVLHTVAGKSMLKHVIINAQKAQVRNIVVVAGHQYEKVRNEAIQCHSDVRVVLQSEQLGTAHAVMQSIDVLKEIGAKRIVVLSGDVPLLNFATIQSVLATLEEKKAQGDPVRHKDAQRGWTERGDQRN